MSFKLITAQLTKATVERNQMLRARFGDKVRKKGDPQTPKMRFSARLAWLVFQLKSAQANIHSALWQATHEEGRFSFSLNKLNELDEEGRDLVKRLKEYEKKVAHFNKTKKLRRV